MDIDYDIVVAGGGPAGLMAAIAAGNPTPERPSLDAPPSRPPSVLLLEKMPRPGRKLLVSGSGRCNISHAGPIEAFLERYGSEGGAKAAGRFLKPSLFGFTNTELLDFFRERGLDFLETEEGKIFPAGGAAAEVLKVLTEELAARGVVTRSGAALASIGRAEGGFALELAPDGGRLRTRCLVLATGGASWPVTGSSGEGYALAAALGLRVVEPGPALTPLRCGGFDFPAAAGLSLTDRELRLYRDGSRVAAGRGDILFTHQGLSGPGVLDLSRSIRTGDELGLILLGGDEAELDEVLRARCAAAPKKLLHNLLEGFPLPARLLGLLAARASGGRELRAAELDKASRRALASSLRELRLPVLALGGWDEAMATRGGVALGELDPKTLEARKVPGLFVAGELLDLDGDTGGYNLQAAFSTGRAAGIAAARRALCAANGG